MTCVPKDMPDPNTPDKTESNKNISKSVSADQPAQSTSSSIETTTCSSATTTCSETPASSDSGQGQSNKPYARQLFQQDIQSNFAKSKKKKDLGPTEQEKQKTSQVPSKDQMGNPSPKPSRDQVENVAQVKGLQSDTTTVPTGIIPAEVLGFDFLRSLQERVEQEETTKEMPFPASVIGHAFLSALVEHQSKLQGNETSEKIIPSVTEEASSVKEKSLPATVIGQAFLKNLVSSQSQLTTAERTESQPADKPSQILESRSLEEQTIPSSVVGQAFLRTLAGTTQTISEPSVPKVIPSTVSQQVFLKSLIDQSKSKESEQTGSFTTIPANVLGQSFLKNLLLQSSTVESMDFGLVSPVPDQEVLSTISEKPSTKQTVSSSAIPANVLGQSFLKTLMLESGSGNEQTREAAIPAPVVGQAFLKTLLKCQSENPEPESSTVQPVPSTVIGQTFLKSLITAQEEASTDTEREDSQIPISGTEDIIPATVVGQAFLKSLVSANTMVPDSSKPKPPQSIPAPVVGQAFLKSLIGEQCKSEQMSSEKSVPASVVGQAFLKTLIEQENVSNVKGSYSKEIPSGVVGQTFLKSLLESEKSTVMPTDSGETVKPQIPSTVVGQTFLKMLVDKGSDITVSSQEIAGTQSDESQISGLKSIPASVVGQSFLKSLVDQGISSSVEVSKSIWSPADQTLCAAEQSKSEGSKQSIPANVVGQAFLKTLFEQSSGQQIQSSESLATEDAKKEKPIPSNVLGQAFLKNLIQQERGPEACCQSAASDSDLSTASTENLIPASVIGSVFLSALRGGSHTNPVDETNLPSESQSTATLPATVVGQAFLKTLLGITDEQSPASESLLLEQDPSGSSSSHGYEIQPKMETTNGHMILPDSVNFKNGNDCSAPSGGACAQQLDFIDSSLALEEPDTIIPPPLEFSGKDDSTSTGNIAGPSSEIDAASSIIGELLNYTKMMQSVIESMKETSDQQPESTNKETENQSIKRH